MKRIAIVLTLLISFTLSYGQSNKVVSAWNYMKPEYNELDKAKEAIDEASQHPKTQSQAKYDAAVEQKYTREQHEIQLNQLLHLFHCHLLQFRL